MVIKVNCTTALMGEIRRTI